jgi:hypothetical protein
MRALIYHVIKNGSFFPISVLLDIFQSFQVLVEQLLLITLKLFG